MIIKLKIDDKEKSFKMPWQSGRKVRDTMAMKEKLNTMPETAESLDEMMSYVVEIFNNQFTLDEIYDGIENKELLPTFAKTVQVIMGEVENKSKLLEVSEPHTKND
jgi:hypothetical protein